MIKNRGWLQSLNNSTLSTAHYSKKYIYISIDWKKHQLLETSQPNVIFIDTKKLTVITETNNNYNSL